MLGLEACATTVWPSFCFCLFCFYSSFPCSPPLLFPLSFFPTSLPFSAWNSLLNSVWPWSCPPPPPLLFRICVRCHSHPVFLSCPLTSSLALEGCAVHSIPTFCLLLGAQALPMNFSLSGDQVAPGSALCCLLRVSLVRQCASKPCM